MKQFENVCRIICNFLVRKLKKYKFLDTREFKIILILFLSGLVIFLLAGCQSLPKDPKKPDPSPRVPVNKTIPPELNQASGLS